MVIGHGSRRAEANAVLRAVADGMAARGGWHAVAAASLELVPPTIAEAYASLVTAGCDHVLAHPYFLFPGNHSAEDIPRALAAAAAEHPGVAWTLTAPLGTHPLLLDVVADRIREATEPVP